MLRIERHAHASHPVSRKDQTSMTAPPPTLIPLLLVLAWAGCSPGPSSVASRRWRRRCGQGEKPPVPVEVAVIEHGPIELLRTFTGTLGGARRVRRCAQGRRSGRADKPGPGR